MLGSRGLEVTSPAIRCHTPHSTRSRHSPRARRSAGDGGDAALRSRRRPTGALLEGRDQDGLGAPVAPLVEWVCPQGGQSAVQPQGRGRCRLVLLLLRARRGPLAALRPHEPALPPVVLLAIRLWRGRRQRGVRPTPCFFFLSCSCVHTRSSQEWGKRSHVVLSVRLQAWLGGGVELGPETLLLRRRPEAAHAKLAPD